MIAQIGQNAPLIIAALLLLLLLSPIIVYILSGWVARRDEIVKNFSHDTVAEYFATFFTTELEVSTGNLVKRFQDQYHQRFGRRHFIIPMVVFVGIACVALFLLVTSSAFSWLRDPYDYETELPLIAVAAMGGAYMWVLYDFIDKARRCNLAPADLSWASFRLVVAAPLGLSVTALFKEVAGYAIAFLLGAFPTHTLITFIRRTVASQVGKGMEGYTGYTDEVGQEIRKLQGISKVSAERFGSLGVSTILQLAHSDPVDLTMRSNFSFVYVIDCCSQALAWIYFEDKLEEMRQYGQRGAIEIGTLLDKVNKKDKESVACVEEIAAKIGMKAEALKQVFEEISLDPYSKFLKRVWATVGPTAGK